MLERNQEEIFFSFDVGQEFIDFFKSRDFDLASLCERTYS
jgi:hypothetical protein